MSKAEPRFDIDLKYGQTAEKLIGTFLDWIASDNGQIEVKRKRILDLKFYIETHCDKGRTGEYQPSGISVTTSAAWAFVIGDTGISVIVPTSELRTIVEDPSSRDKEELDGRCPTRGKLIDLSVLLWRCRQRRDKLEVVSRPTRTLSPEPPQHERVEAPHVDQIKW